MKSFNCKPVHALALAATLSLGATAHAGGDDTFRLTVLHNNDGESQLIDAGSGIEDFGGAARFANLARGLRFAAEQDGAAVLVSSGDNFLAGPEFNASLANGVPFFDSIALDLIRYDALTLGNHDFDFGPDITADFIEGFRGRAKFLSANLDFSGEPRLQALADQGRIGAAKVVRKDGELIGIIGATTTDLPFVSSPRNVIVNDVQPLVQQAINNLTALGVNKIVLVSHLQSIDEEIELTSMLSGVDIVVAGGGDELLANDSDELIPGDVAELPYPVIAVNADGADVPVVTTPGNYKYVGELIVDFDAAGNVVNIDSASGPRRVAGGDNPDAVQPRQLVQVLAVDPVIAALEDLATNVIGTTEVALDGIRANIRGIETNEGNLIADAFRWQANELASDFGLPTIDVAVMNGGGIRNDDIRGPGDLSELDTFDMVPFANFNAVLAGVSRDIMRNVLENAVSAVEFGSGRFAQVSGLRFTYDPAGTPMDIDDDTGEIVVAGNRVRDVVLDDGTVIVSDGAVVPGAALTVATAAFLATGGDEYPWDGTPFVTIGVTDQQSLRNYIETGLGGEVTAAQYPEGGEGRIQTP